MTKIKILTILMLANSLLYAENSVTTWHPNYTNNLDVNKTLCIEGAEGLSVNISGNTEKKYDTIAVGDKIFSGSLSETFDVSGPCITATFKTDSSVVSTGVSPTVTITETNTTQKTWTPVYKADKATIQTKEICIEGAEYINVKITGETEEYTDFITLKGKIRSYIHHTNSSYQKSFSGHLNAWTISRGPCVTVEFVTDQTIKQGVGPTVTVSKTSAPFWGITWKPKYIKNNYSESIEMCDFIFDDATLFLNVEGETEKNNDFVLVNNKYRASGLLDGPNFPLDEIVGQQCIKAKFQTNDSIIQGKGLTLYLGVWDS